MKMKWTLAIIGLIAFAALGFWFDGKWIRYHAGNGGYLQLKRLTRPEIQELKKVPDISGLLWTVRLSEDGSCYAMVGYDSRGSAQEVHYYAASKGESK